MKKFTRRHFLQSTAQSALSLSLLTSCFQSSPKKRHTRNKGYALGSGKYFIDSTQKYVLSLFNLNDFSSTPLFIPVDFFVHGMTQHPTHHEVFCFFEKKGPGGCEVNLKNKKVTKQIKPTPEHYFYGHSAYSNDGKLIYCTEAHISNKSGLVVIRETNSMKVIGTFPTYGYAPHDCKIIDNGKTLVVTNGGLFLDLKKTPSHLPNVAYIDIKTQKLISKVVIPKEDLNAGHFAISSDSDLIIISAPASSKNSDLGGISFKPFNQDVRFAKAPKKILKSLLSETLSLAIDTKSQTVAATNPLGNIVTFWNYKTGEFKDSLTIEYPRSLGITLDAKHFVLGHGKDANISLIDCKTLKIEKRYQKNNVGFSGSHLMVI